MHLCSTFVNTHCSTYRGHCSIPTLVRSGVILQARRPFLLLSAIADASITVWAVLRWAPWLDSSRLVDIADAVGINGRVHAEWIIFINQPSQNQLDDLVLVLVGSAQWLAQSSVVALFTVPRVNAVLQFTAPCVESALAWRGSRMAAHERADVLPSKAW